MSAEDPGVLRTAALKVFRRLPAAPSQAIVRFVSPQYVVGAVVLIEHNGALLTLRQTHRRGLSLPGGLVEAGELPAEAVRREVREETGMAVDPGDAVATVFDPEVRHCDVIFRVVCDHRPQVQVASEATSYAWIDPQHWPDEQDDSTQRIMRAVQAAVAQPRVGRLLD